MKILADFHSKLAKNVNMTNQNLGNRKKMNNLRRCFLPTSFLGAYI